jgi:hypothetical protein
MPSVQGRTTDGTTIGGCENYRVMGARIRIENLFLNNFIKVVNFP